MKRRSFVHRIGICAITILLLTATATTQEPAKQSADPQVERVKEMIRQAWQEADQFVKAGARENDPNWPGRKWAAALWQYREQHPGTAAATQATGEALHLLAHAEQVSELTAKTDSLKPDDAAWKRVLGVLLEAADRKKDYDYLISKSRHLLQHATERDVKQRAQFALGQGYWKKGESEQARAAFRKVIAEYPNTSHAKEAEGAIHEIESLNLGQPAPLFSFRAMNGEPVALSDFKGKVVLLNFWASW